MASPKIRIRYVCQSCGHNSLKWAGQCPSCSEWNSLVEEAAPSSSRKRGIVEGQSVPTRIRDVDTEDTTRIATGMKEFDRVLGGGIVPGSVLLVGGDPGIGKSTLMLQISNRLAERELKVLYVTGEESPAQTRLRAERVGALAESLYVVAETDMDRIDAHVRALKPDAITVDSIQMIHTPELPAAPGTVGQVRESTARLVSIAKSTGTALFVIGHVTKDGAIAGPRTLEHLVDCVFYIEGDPSHHYRILRGVKNRFGATHEVCILDMREDGLVEVDDPTALFLSGEREGLEGSIAVPVILGSRTLMVEVQALTARSWQGIPTRRVSGVDGNRVAMIVAVLQRRCGLPLGEQDVYVNVVGGVRIDDPGADLAIAAAILGSYGSTAYAAGTIAIGEIGLAGEIRKVQRIPLRVKEAARLGFTRAIVPASCLDDLGNVDGMDIVPASMIAEARTAFGFGTGV